jgi:SAM-dependent methyltransferase
LSRGTRYPFVESILREQAGGARAVLGGAVYRDLFEGYVGTDLPGNPYEGPGDIAVHCDGQRLPFAPGTFDAAFVVAALYQIPDASAVLDEVRRVLRPGGAFLIFDYNTKTTERLRASERGGANLNHSWSAGGLARLAEARGFKATVINHHLHGSQPGNSAAKRIKRSGLYRLARAAMSEDWIVIRAEK